jgi:hypothetical protein
MSNTVSLETATLLKEAGFPQPPNWKVYAPNIEELLEQLPYSLRYVESDYWLWITKGKYCYEVRYTDAHHQYPKYIQQADTLTEALAKMWLRLKIDGVIIKGEEE